MQVSTNYRMKCMYDHRCADRAPITDAPWATTINRWHAEGMPQRMSYQQYFGLDNIVAFGVDNSPRYPITTIEKTEDYTILTTAWGTTRKQWNVATGVPHNISHTIIDADSWMKTKERMTPTPDRVNWDYLKSNYGRWRDEGAWIRADLWFGFDVTHSGIIGTETMLLAMADDPEWVMDIIGTCLETDLALLEMVWDAGYHFDEIYWPDDMGYKGKQFFSVSMYRDILKPFHQQAADWGHAKGVKVHMHSCGNVMPFVPELVDIGIDLLEPLEVKAGNDPILLKADYGQQIAFKGAINALHYSNPDVMWDEMRRTIPIMKKEGGYVIATDHSVPDNVSIRVFNEFVRLGKHLGSYE